VTSAWVLLEAITLFQSFERRGDCSVVGVVWGFVAAKCGCVMGDGDGDGEKHVEVMCTCGYELAVVLDRHLACTSCCRSPDP